MSGTMGFGRFDDIAEVCHVIEELGFSSFYASDHLHGVAGADPLTPLMEPWTILAALAPITKRLRLGCMVSGVTYRHPAMLAKICSTIDVISNGRLDMGIGAAWSRDDHVAYGLNFPPLKERQARLEEAVEIIHGMWTQDRFTFVGEHYQVREAPLSPRPIQKPRPPILIAAVGERGLALAAKRAEMWASVSTPNFAARCIQTLEQKCAELGRDPSEIEYSQCIGLLLTNDTGLVRRTLDARIKQVQSRERRPVNAQARNAIEGESVDEQVRASLLAGDSTEVKEAIQRYVEVGVTHFVIMGPRPFDRQVVERFSNEVMSHFLP